LTPGSGSGSWDGEGTGLGINIPDNISESLVTFFGLKIISTFFVAVPYPGSRAFFTLDLGSGMEKSNPDPQHWKWTESITVG
jgi:hypothetical protein